LHSNVVVVVVVVVDVVVVVVSGRCVFSVLCENSVITVLQVVYKYITLGDIHKGDYYSPYPSMRMSTLLEQFNT